MKKWKAARVKSCFAALALVLGLPLSAWGQSAVLQGGIWTSGHVPMYSQSGSSQPIVQDGGSAAGGGPGVGAIEFLQVSRPANGVNTAPYANSGTGPYNSHNCFYDAPATNSTGYHYFCFDANAQGGGLMAYGAGGTASTLPLQFIVNGATYSFPFTVGGIVGPSVSVVNDAACWNNTTGTLLKDCGAFVTVGGNNTWTGTNNFTGTFEILGTAESFPPSGNIVGTSDAQTLTNKSIAASQINSGTLPTTVMPGLTGDVTSSDGSVATTIANNAVTNAKLATQTQNTVKGAATSTAVANLAVPSCSGAGNALQWTTNTGFGCGTLTNQTAGWGLTGSSTFSISTSQPPYGFDVPINLGLTASAAGSALTIAVKGANGSDPSATNPVSVPFRSTTLATGTPVWTAITSALSITIPSAATLGTSNSVPFRIWIFMEYNGGTPELAVATCSSTSQVYSCASWETNRVTTTTITGFATVLGTPYATTGNSNDAVRIIGYCDYSSGLATAGSWASACTTLQVLGPGVKKPGELIQALAGSSTSATSGTTSFSTAVPALSITPTSSPNLIRIQAYGALTSAASHAAIAQIFRAAGASAACTTGVGAAIAQSASGVTVPIALSALDAPGSSSQQTYTACFKSDTGTPAYCSAANFTETCTIELQEIMGRREEPANDNVNPGIYSMTG